MYNTGTIRYIGKLDFDILDLIYIGVHLDMPVGTCDGSVKGRRYFQCPPNHGVFVRPSDVMCVTGRKVREGKKVQASLYTRGKRKYDAYKVILASFPGPAQLSVAYMYRTVSDGKLGGAWE